MTKRRSSLSGRGAEILFGTPAPVEIEPREPEVALAENEPAGLEPVPEEFLSEPEPDAEESVPASLVDEDAPSPMGAPLPEGDEWQQALFEEAMDGEPGPGREEDLSVLEEEPPPTPEIEMAFVEEALDAEEPPEPVTEEPIPTAEETMEEIELGEDEAIFETPPPESTDVTSGVLPARPAPSFMDMGEMGALALGADVQDPGRDIEFLELSDRELTKEEEAILLRRMGRARIKALDDEITSAYRQVRNKVGDSEAIATESYNLLLKSRDIVLRRDADRFPQAEYYIEQVYARLKRADDSEKGAKRYAWWITAWGFLWGALFLAVLISLNFPDVLEFVQPANPVDSSVDTVVFLSSMVWGGIGGVVAVWYSLFKHVGRRDFDTQYNLSYVGKPFLGLVLGATVFMLFHLLLVLGILPAGLQDTVEATTTGVTPWIMYPLAWACGFKENRIFDLVDRVIKRIFSGKEEEPAEPVEAEGQPAE